MEEETMLLRPGVSIKPTVSGGDVENILKNNYGMAPKKITELNSYDDKNYKVRAERGFSENEDVYVLKIMNLLDSKKTAFLEAQNAMMIFLGKNGVSCPKPVKTKFGSYFTIEEFESGKHAVKLLEYVPGFILHQVPSSNKLFYQAGEFVAKMDLALKNFHHPAYDTHRTVWMLDSVPELKQFLFAINESRKRKMMEEIIDQFQKRVMTSKNKLESGMIHGDFNEQNVVVNKIQDEWTITSILDFGDTNYSCYLYEMAIAMTYMMIHAKSLDAGDYFIAGYSSVRRIPEVEFDLLKVCIMARLCQSLVMGAYSITNDPENSYLLVTAASGWSMLEMIWEEPEEKMIRRWKTAAKKCDLNGN